MQGNLNEIDIRSLLKLIELGQRSGFLWVENDNNMGEVNHHQRQEKKSQWVIFFDNGQIIYAVEGQSDTSKIDDYLRYYRIKDWQNRIELASLSSSVIPEYGYLWALLEQKIITPNQARNIIYSLVSDVLFDLFSLHQGSFSFCNALVLEPQVTTFEISSLTSEISQQTLDWKKLYPYIQSPRQFPILTDIEKLSSNLPQPTLNKLKHWADGQTSLRQLARCLNKDTVTVAKVIYPYMQDNLVRMVYSNTRKLSMQPQPNQKNRIVCIDDVVNTAKNIESTLHAGGYDAIAITNPLEAIGQIFNIKPDLIFCAFTMSDLDGWEICAMLRNSSTFRKVPIIILGTSCKFIDRMRAKMIGATDYLSQPFQNNELLILVDKYLQSQPAFQ